MESRQGSDQRPLNDPQARGCDGKGCEDVRKTVRDQEVDGRGCVTKGEEENPEGGGVEEPVRRSPARGCGEEPAVGRQYSQSFGAGSKRWP